MQSDPIQPEKYGPVKIFVLNYKATASLGVTLHYEARADMTIFNKHL